MKKVRYSAWVLFVVAQGCSQSSLHCMAVNNHSPPKPECRRYQFSLRTVANGDLPNLSAKGRPT